MRFAKSVLFGAMILALTPTVSSAQDQKIHVNFGGGPTFISGDFGSKFNTGWGPAIGVTFDANQHLSAQFEYAYRWFDVSSGTLPIGATAFGANHQTHQLDFNLIFNLSPPDSAVRVLCHRRTWRVLPQGGDHPVRRHRLHLRPVLVRLRLLPGDLGDRIARRLGLRVQHRGRRRVQDRRGGGILHRVAVPLRRRARHPRRPPGSTRRRDKRLQAAARAASYYPLTFGFRF